eukprot:763482-Hanusia_phi.AAC.4
MPPWRKLPPVPFAEHPSTATNMSSLRPNFLAAMVPWRASLLQTRREDPLCWTGSCARASLLP